MTLSIGLAKGDVAKRNLAIGVFVLVWMVPFCIPVHEEPLLTFWQEWWAAVLMVIALLLLIVRAQRLRVPSSLFIPGGMIVLLVIQYLSSRYGFKDQLIVPGLYMGLMALAAIFAATLCYERRDPLVQAIAIASLIGSMFSVGVQLLQVTGLAEFYAPYISINPKGTYFANLNQLNNLAAYLSLGLGALFYLRLKGLLRLWSYTAALILLTYGMALTGQRSTVVYFFVLVVVKLMAGSSCGRSGRHLWADCVVAVALYVGFVVLAMPQLALGPSKLYSPIRLVVSNHERWVYLQCAWHIFMQHPMLGIGFSQFWAGFIGYVAEFGLSRPIEVPTHSHNLVSMLLAETGLVGFLILLIPLALWFYRLKNAPKSASFWLGIMQLAVIGLYSLIEFPLWYTYWLIIAGFWIGYLDQSVVAFSVRKLQFLGYAFFLGASIVLMNLAFAYLKLQDLENTPSDINIDTQSDLIRFRTEAVAELSNHWYFGSLASVWISGHLVKLDFNDLKKKLDFNTRAVLVRPDSINIQREIVFLVLIGDIDRALYWTSISASLFPDWANKFPRQLKSYSRRWPEKFDDATVQRLLSVKVVSGQ